ncbi:DUF4956 domain-containing protein [Serinicoccus sp. CUA-874]|uniref:DUF4956 domain-containing protein n=1 Tax=Serinicoccus sp. CUA-874 TaxID=1517939 RepID=UPI0009654CDD|nr:DUF4956 domain-containing protein [Serinicoccus sp. CUA-874]OLT16615.1 DUF4956 domain-containing protein [Serinicoccus sp. CUA-874]
MNALILPAVDLLAIVLLTFAIYLPRHRRTELVPAFLGVNVGVLAVSMALTSSAATVGLGLGLFGVLSIIRLRSSELSQREIAYYFAALTLGLLGGIGVTSLVVGIGLMALVVLALAVGDHTRVAGPQEELQQQLVVLDRAVTDPDELRDRLRALLGGEVVTARTVRLDLVNDSTQVEVGWRASGRTSPTVQAPAGASAREAVAR